MTSCATIVSRGDPSSAGTMKKPSVVMNTNNPAAAMPGADSGRKTVKKRVAGPAPNVSAACPSDC